MQSQPSRIVDFLLTALLLSAAAAVLQLIHWNPGEHGVGSGYDSGIFAYCGHALAAGGDLYAYCTDNKPPGIFLINAVASLATTSGADWRPLWVLAWLAQTITWVGVACVAERITGDTHARLIAGVGVVATYLVLDGVATVELFSMPWQLLVAWCAYLMLTRNDRSPLLPAVLAGVGVIVLFLMRPNNVAAAVLPVSACIAALATGRWQRATTIAAGGVLGAAAAVGAAVLVTGPSALEGTLEFALAQGVSYSGTQRSSRLYAAISTVAWSAALLVPFAWATWIARDSSARADGRPARSLREVLRAPWTLLLVLWFTTEVLLSSVSARRYPHYAQMLLVPLALLIANVVCARIAHADGDRASIRDAIRRAGELAVTLVVCLLPVLPTIRDQASADAEIKQVRSYTRRLADTLARAGADTGGLFVWGAPPALYVVLNSAAPVRHLAPSTLATPGFSKPAYFTETLDCLAGAAPLVIVDGFHRTTVGMMRDTAVVPTMTELPEFAGIRAFVASHYRLDGVVPGTGTAMWRRTSDPSTMRATRGPSARDCRPRPGQWALRSH